MKTVLVLVLSLSIASAGCASASGTRVPVQMPTISDTTSFANAHSMQRRSCRSCAPL